MLFLAGLVAYLGVCYRSSLAYLGVADMPAGVAGANDLFWLGRWRMFTELRAAHTDLDAEALVGDRWEARSLAALYPSAWDEGPGYLRDDFYTRPERLGRLADDLCGRTPGATRVRFTLVTWARTRGQVDQPRTDATRTELADTACGAPREAGERPRGGGGGGGGRRGGRRGEAPAGATPEGGAP